MIKSRSASIERPDTLDKEEELDIQPVTKVAASPGLVPQKTIESETISTLEGVSFEPKEAPIPQKKAREAFELDLRKKVKSEPLTLIDESKKDDQFKSSLPYHNL